MGRTVTVLFTDDGRRSPSDEEFEHRLPKYRRRESDDEGEQEGEGPFTGGGGIGRIGRRRERLYRRKH